MENIKENQNVKELTDEQLKEVSGGRPPACGALTGCVKQDANCNCIECQAGWVLDSGGCIPQ